MTTPGGVTNLPAGALTEATIESQLQDTSEPAMRTRAAARIPSTFNSSTGGDPSVDLSPFGIINRLFSGFNSTVANADPADITGPEDLPGLLWEFISNLPVVGQFIDLLDAIAGHYEGEDQILLTIQAIFAPIRALIDLVAGPIVGAIPTPEEIAAGWNGLVNFINGLGQAIVDAWNGIPAAAEGLIGEVSEAIAGLLGIGKNAQATADAGWNQITAINAILAGLTGSNASGSDEFDGPETADLSYGYTQAPFIGSGTGKYKRSGTGRAVYARSGILQTGVCNLRNVETFTTKYQTIGAYLPLAINDSALYLFTRCYINENGLQGNIFDIGEGQIKAGYVQDNAIVYYPGAEQSYVPLNGEYWEFSIGDPNTPDDPTNDYKYVLKRNGVTMFNYYDSVHYIDADDPLAVRIAWGAYSAAAFPLQLPAPEVDTIAWFDKEPTTP